MFKTLFRKITGDPTKKLVGSLKPIVDEVAGLETELRAATDEDLKLKTETLKERVAAGETLDDLLVEAFALVREASRRTTGLRHYDVQIMGGVLLHQGNVVEMRTGEGKTLVATLPLYLNALTGRGAHLVTVNDYLVRRDGGWMGKIFHALGLTVGCIGPLNFSALYDPEYVNPGTELEDERLVHWRPVTRQQAYQADVTYGTSSEFGFDYLRDNMVTRPEDLVQRSLAFAVIDEVDNILIDEARTPLIISGPAAQASDDYVRFAQYVRNLRPNTADEEQEPNGHYNVDEKSRTITLTEMGIGEIEKRVPEVDTEAGDSLYDPRFYHLTYYLDNALRAQYLYKRDHQYVVQNNQVIIVDDFTGRLMPGRRYSEGLHEAIEAKEGVQIQRETVTVATITLQNYFRLYEKLAGMTGTALTDAEEFDKIYNLQVSPLPTNVEYIVETGAMGLREYRRKQENTDEVYYARPEAADTPVFYRRTDFPDQVYGTAQAKDQAIINEIQRVQESGRPILVGTTSVEHSETIHSLLQRERIPHSVLNAKLHQSEAWIVAQAGRKQAVTISTNMAGRGTDILLGGNPEGLAADMLEQELFDRPLLAQVAQKLLAEGLDSARALAQRHSKLSPALADALQTVKQQYDEALVEIQEAQVIGYLARRLQEPYQVDYNDLLNVLRLVRVGDLRQARAYLAEQDKDVALVEDALRQFQAYSHYQEIHQDPRQVAQFLTELVFDEHYNARAALIRAVMGGRRDEALRLTQTYPALPSALIERIEQIRAQAERDRAAIRELGGLHVIGSERHESRRIDNQLRGRAARQGDPGSSRFFLSLEDDLMKRFGGERLKNFMARTNIPEDMPIESSLLDRIIESSQERIEGYNFDIRKNVVEYDDVMNRQRQSIYDERRAILMGQAVDLDEKVDQAFANAIGELAQNYLDDYSGFMEREIGRAIGDFSTEATDTINLNGVLTRLRGWLPGLADLDRHELAALSAEQLTRRLLQLAQENQANGYNLYQLLQAMNRFLPLLPPVPNLAAILVSRRTGLLQVRENIRRQFLLQVEQFFNDFLAGQIEETERATIWQRAAERVQQAFTHFNVEGVAVKTFEAQQDHFRQEAGDALRDLLLDGLSAVTSEQLVTALGEYVQKARDTWRERIGEEEYRNFQRLLLLEAIDKEWRDYLTAMDDLRREINLEAIGQRDPKVEYKRRSYQMFTDMRQNIERDVVNRFFHQVAGYQDYVRQVQAAAARRTLISQSGLQAVQRPSGKGVELRRDIPKVGRNDPCPCGSGKKYKNCHMRQEQGPAGGRNGQQGKQPVASKGKR